MPNKRSKPVLLSTEDGDLGIVPASKAKRQAKLSAKEEGKPVTMRDPTTDEVLDTVKSPNLDDIPDFLDLKKTMTPEQLAQATQKARDTTDRDKRMASLGFRKTGKKPVAKPTQQPDVTNTETNPTESESPMRTSTKTKLPVPPAAKGHIARKVLTPTEQVAAGRSNVARKPAVSKLQKQLAKAGVVLTKAELRNVAKEAAKETPIQRLPAGKGRVSKAKATSTARTPVKGTTNVRKGSDGYKVPAKGSKVELVVQMACRKTGASRAELIEATGWDVAPWKWNFENPQGYGYCQRFGYTLETRDGKDGETRYFLTKIK